MEISSKHNSCHMFPETRLKGVYTNILESETDSLKWAQFFQGGILCVVLMGKGFSGRVTEIGGTVAVCLWFLLIEDKKFSFCVLL